MKINVYIAQISICLSIASGITASNQPTIPLTCRPVINNTKMVLYSYGSDTILKEELQCLTDKHRRIIICSEKDFEPLKKNFDANNFKFLRIYKDHFHQKKESETEIIIYNQLIERTALLLQKMLLTDHLYYSMQKIDMRVHNKKFTARTIACEYALGKMLEYPEEDIQFFYQRKAYRKQLPEKDKENLAIINNIKNISKAASNNLWLQTFNTDKKQYELWIQLNEKFNNKELIAQNNAMNTLIQTFNRTLPQPQSLEQSTPKSADSWWKKPAAYAAGIAALGASMYAYFKQKTQAQ